MLTGGGSIDNKGVDQEIFTYYVKSYEIYLVDISKGIREIHHDYEKNLNTKQIFVFIIPSVCSSLNIAMAWISPPSPIEMKINITDVSPTINSPFIFQRETNSILGESILRCPCAMDSTFRGSFGCSL